MTLLGRTKLYTTVADITRDNVVDVLNSVLPYHYTNAAEEDYLYWYRRGKTPVLHKEKKTRPEINNIVVENVASEIVAFKNGYFMTRPAFYIDRKGNSGQKAGEKTVNKLNDILYLSGKHDADNEIIDWFHTVGVGVAYVDSDGDEISPIKVYALDPRCAFNIYDRTPAQNPIAGVSITAVPGTELNKSRLIFDVVTKKHHFVVAGGEVTDLSAIDFDAGGSATEVISATNNVKWLGEIPIIEYTYDRNRMSAFESVMSLLDEINAEQSRRSDAIEQFVNSLLIFYNCKLGEDDNGNTITVQQIREAGAMFLKSTAQEQADIKEISSQLDQTQTQIYLDNLMKSVCDIAGVPFSEQTNGGTSDNVGAVYLRSGWSMADVFARNCEDLYRKSNKLFDKVFFKIVKQKADLTVDPKAIDIQLTRNEMENLLVKTQGALNLKQLGYGPVGCIERSGLSNDPEGDYVANKEFMDAVFEVVKAINEPQGTDNTNNAPVPNIGNLSPKKTEADDES